jgi:hypothetical protein
MSKGRSPKRNEKKKAKMTAKEKKNAKRIKKADAQPGLNFTSRMP